MHGHKIRNIVSEKLNTHTHHTLRNNKQNRKLYAIDLRRINIVVPKIPINLCQFSTIASFHQIASTFRTNNNFYPYPLFYFQVSKYTLFNANRWICFIIGINQNTEVNICSKLLLRICWLYNGFFCVPMRWRLVREKSKSFHFIY